MKVSKERIRELAHRAAALADDESDESYSNFAAFHNSVIIPEFANDPDGYNEFIRLYLVI